MVILHHWSRSFRDCLLKTLQSRFKDDKGKDRDRVIDRKRAEIVAVAALYLHAAFWAVAMDAQRGLK